MAAEPTNFKIYNPLEKLQEGGSGGTITPGSVTGGPGGSIAPGTITNLNLAPNSVTGGPGGSIAPGTVTGGVGGDLAAGTVTGGPGGNIAANTITAGELAPGAAAANINSGPAGSINASQVGPAAPGSIPGASIANNSITNAQIAPGTITGASIAPATVANSNIVPGPANTIKGTNSLSNVDDFIIGTGLTLTSGPSPTLSASGVAAPNAGNSQFGLVEFGAIGDLTETSANSGIALIKAGAVTNSKIAPGAVTGGPGGSIAANTVTSGELAPGAVTGAAIAPGTITGGPGGNLAAGTVTGGPGGNIAANTITNSELAAGAAAANINAGPAGSINSSQIAGGPFLSLAGGTMTGAITQPLAPVAGTDLANKTYVDSLVGPKAFSKWVMNAQQNVTAVIPSYASLVFGSQETLPADATTPSCNITIDGTSSIITITSTSANKTAFKLHFHCETFANFAVTTDACNGLFRFFDTVAASPFGSKGTCYFIGVSNLNTPLSSVTTPATLDFFADLAPGASLSFSAQCGIVGTTTAAVGEAPAVQSVEPYVYVEQIY